MLILFSMVNRLLWLFLCSGWMYFCQIFMFEVVILVLVDSRNRIVWVLGSIDRVSFGLLLRVFRLGVLRICRFWCSSGWLKLIRVWCQVGMCIWLGLLVVFRVFGWKLSWIVCFIGSVLVLVIWVKVWVMFFGLLVFSGMFIQWCGMCLNWVMLVLVRCVLIGSRWMQLCLVCGLWNSLVGYMVVCLVWDGSMCWLQLVKNRLLISLVLLCENLLMKVRVMWFVCSWCRVCLSLVLIVGLFSWLCFSQL